MCLLVVCKPNSTPSKEDLHAGACSNPHGFGFAIIAGDKIISERSMSAKKSIKRFLELREQYPDGYAMWHARYATHGVKNELNCHPFIVGGDERTYLAHNGVLDTYIAEGDKRSDTRVFAEDTLPRLGGVSALDDENIWRLVEGWANGNKIAVLTLDPNAEGTLYLINDQLGTWDSDGVWWSNSSHKRVYATTVTTTTPSVQYRYDSYWDTKAYDYGTIIEDISDYKSMLPKDEADSIDDDEIMLDNCPYCQEIISLDKSYNYCEWCQGCMECGSTPIDCMCYIPAYHNYKSERNYDMLY